MNEITIRAIEPSDLEQLHALYSQPSVVIQTLQLPFEPRSYFQQRVERHDNRHRLVAVIDETVVGDVSLLVHSRPRMRHTGGLGMAVHRDYRRLGIGRSLMQAILNLAENWYGLTRIELEVFTDNEAAIGLYKSMGFELEGTLRCYAMRDGKLADVHKMARIRHHTA